MRGRAPQPRTPFDASSRFRRYLRWKARRLFGALRLLGGRTLRLRLRWRRDFGTWSPIVRTPRQDRAHFLGFDRLVLEQGRDHAFDLIPVLVEQPPAVFVARLDDLRTSASILLATSSE